MGIRHKLSICGCSFNDRYFKERGMKKCMESSCRSACTSKSLYMENPRWIFKQKTTVQDMDSITTIFLVSQLKAFVSFYRRNGGEYTL